MGFLNTPLLYPEETSLVPTSPSVAFICPLLSLSVLIWNTNQRIVFILGHLFQQGKAYWSNVLCIHPSYMCVSFVCLYICRQWTTWNPSLLSVTEELNWQRNDLQKHRKRSVLKWLQRYFSRAKSCVAASFLKGCISSCHPILLHGASSLLWFTGPILFILAQLQQCCIPRCSQTVQLASMWEAGPTVKVKYMCSLSWVLLSSSCLEAQCRGAI